MNAREGEVACDLEQDPALAGHAPQADPVRIGGPPSAGLENLLSALAANDSPDLAPQTLSVQVIGKQVVGDFAKLRLQPVLGSRLQHRPGQYLKIVLADGKRRPFSIANAPGDDGVIELHVRRIAGGDFSPQVFGPLALGDRLRIEGPFGRLLPRAAATPSERPLPVLLIAGGTGFAPLKAIAEHLLRSGSTRPITLYWGARHQDELYDHALARAWELEHGHFRYVPVISDDAGVAQMRQGLVHEAVLRDHPELTGHEVYLSGPPAMVRSAAAGLLAADLASERLHYDRHDEPVVATPSPAP